MIEQIKAFCAKSEQDLRSKLSSDKINIAIIAYYPTYRTKFGNLIPKLKQKYNVFTIVDRILNDDFEKSGHHNILFPYRIIGQGQTYYLNMDIPEIELILTADGVGYENGKIDREFLSKKATRIYFPHTFNIATGYNIPVDYFIVPSKTLMKIYAHHIKDSKRLLPCGYPTLDVAISKYHYQSQNTLTYAPTLRYADPKRSANLMAFAGFDCNLIEWLLKNTHYNISYRAHPINYLNNHIFHNLIKQRWQGEKRVNIDNKLGTAFYNYSDFLITDTSGTAFTYSYTTLRPSFFFAPYPLDEKSKDGNHIIPAKTAKNFSQLKSLIESIEEKKDREYFYNLRESDIYNVGKSEEAILEKIEEILAKR